MNLDELRIGIFAPTSSRYRVLNAMTEHLYGAFRAISERRAEIRVELFEIEHSSAQSFWERLQGFDPDCLLLFNSFFPDAGGNFLCDLLQCPTLFWLVDAPFHFSIRHSPLARLACIDRIHCKIAEELGHSPTFFLPHAVCAARQASPDSYRPYLCTMFASGISYHALFANWRKTMGDVQAETMREVAESYLAGHGDLPTLFGERIGFSWPPSKEREGEDELSEFARLLAQIDLYAKGVGRVRLLEALAPLPIDLFGGGDFWKELLEDRCPHVTHRGELSFPKALEIMEQSRFVLSSCTSIRDGAHERILEALSRGACVVTAENRHLHSFFNRGLLFYSEGNVEGLRSSLFALKEEEEVRRQTVFAGQENLVAGFLWRQRAEECLQCLESWLR